MNDFCKNIHTKINSKNVQDKQKDFRKIFLKFPTARGKVLNF